MLSRTKRVSIIDMHRRGHSRLTIAQELGLSITTVSRVIRAHEGKPSPVGVLSDMRARERAKKLEEVDAWLLTK